MTTTINSREIPSSAHLYAFLGCISHLSWRDAENYDEATITGTQAKKYAFESGLVQAEPLIAEPLISDYPNGRKYNPPMWAAPRMCGAQRHPRTRRIYWARELPDCITDYYTFSAKHAAWSRCENYAALLKNEPERTGSSEAQLQYWRKALGRGE